MIISYFNLFYNYYNMITLHLGIGEGEVLEISFNNKIEIIDYINEIKERFFNRVWLLANGDEFGNIFITEKIELIILIIDLGIVDFNGCIDLDCFNIHLHEYQSYEDAYKVATDMREGNPLAYNM